MRMICLVVLLFSFTALAKPCGLTGSIEERIKECAQSKGNFALVTLTEKGVEVYKDLKSGLIWGNRISSDFNHYGSQKACKLELSGHESLSHLKWRLPSIKEFETASQHGMKLALPNLEHHYWSSTGVKTKRSRRRRAAPVQVYIWNGFEEKIDSGDLKEAASVRCVSRE